MNNELLELYNSELNYFRRLSEEFAGQHPKVAGRLKLDKHGEDPHVSRLIESFAFLNARIRLKLDDEFPELCQAFLNVLYPEYLSPIPSYAIATLKLPTSQFGLVDGYRVKSKTELTTDSIDGEPCRYRTSYPVDLWPIEITDAIVQTPPFNGPASSLADHSRGMVKIELSCYSRDIKFKDLSLDKLRIHLNGTGRYVYDLYELILNNAIGAVIAPNNNHGELTTLSPTAISPVGFNAEDALLDYSPRSKMGFHLLSEFCNYPKKFLFFDVNLNAQELAEAGNQSQLTLYIYLDQLPRNLESNISAANFCLGATPIVNLFQQRAEPISLKITKGEYRVIPDARRALANEIYSIDRVVSHANEIDTEVLPFYSANQAETHESSNFFWYPNRRDISYRGGTPAASLGTDVYLNFVGLDGNPADLANRTLDVYTTCLNRNYPNELPRNVKFNFSGNNAMILCELASHPTETYRPRLTNQMHWRLISHLSLNHMSLLDDDQGANSLREILRLYNFTNSRGIEMMIDGLTNASLKRIVGRIDGSGGSGFCKGTEIKLTLDETKFSGGGEYLFSSVLDHFLAMFTSINSFTKTTVETKQGKQFQKWPLRAGDTELL